MAVKIPGRERQDREPWGEGRQIVPGLFEDQQGGLWLEGREERYIEGEAGEEVRG